MFSSNKYSKLDYAWNVINIYYVYIYILNIPYDDMYLLTCMSYLRTLFNYLYLINLVRLYNYAGDWFTCNIEFFLLQLCHTLPQRGCLCCPHINPTDILNNSCQWSRENVRFDPECEYSGCYGLLSGSDSDCLLQCRLGQMIPSY